MGYSSPTRLALGFLHSGKRNRSAWDGLARGTGSPGTSDRFSHHGEPQPGSLELIFRELSLILDSGNPSMSSAARFHAEPSNYHVIWSRLDPFRDNLKLLYFVRNTWYLQKPVFRAVWAGLRRFVSRKNTHLWKVDDAMCKNLPSVRCGLASGGFFSRKNQI